jgi:CheY-like chemotaxis protein
MTKILVADDEADLEVLIKQKFRRQIREHEYEFIFAINWNDALRNWKKIPRLILCFRTSTCRKWMALHCLPG